MCDEAMVERWAREALTRRQFGAVTGAAALAACSTSDSVSADGGATGTMGELSESAVTIATADGTLDGFFVHPASGKSPGVILWPDIAGLREAKRKMARRLAGEGYAVLVPNPYYRDVAGEQFADFASFAASGGFQKVKPWRDRFTVDTISTDTRAIADWLHGQEAVNAVRGIGAQGYCMTGSFAVVGAAADARVRAAASFHGGGLVRDQGPSPHTMLRSDARYLIAIARDDDAAAPGEKTALREAAEAAGALADIAVYDGDHGWCVLDSRAYAEPAAEQAWTTLLAMYAEAL